MIVQNGLFVNSPFWNLLKCTKGRKVFQMLLPRLKDLREDHDLKQSQLAEVLKCGQSCYSKYEKGKRDLPNELLITLAKFYGTSADYLLGLTDNPQPYPPPQRKQ